MSVERIIGIDFGTSTSVIRVRRYEDGKAIDVIPKAVTFNNGASMVPTLVQKPSNGQAAYFGYDAEVRRQHSIVYQNFKRDLENLDQAKREQARSLTTEFFKYLYETYSHQSESNFLGESTDSEKTYISYPVRWQEETREFMLQAASEAGFPNVQGLDEAQAAIRAVIEQYSGILEEKEYLKAGKASNILLIDMGAGTTDLVICRYTPGAHAKTDILCTWPKAGDALFGGSQIDELLYTYITEAFPDERAVKHLELSKFKAWKEMIVSPVLLRNETVDYFEALNQIADVLNKDLDFQAINRDKFETIASSYLPVLPALISETLNVGNMSGKDIDLVILTGGHSQWYFVREMLCGKMPQYGKVLLSKVSADPDRIISIARPQETVALGLVYSEKPVVLETLTHVKEVKPDCTHEGNIEYWVKKNGKAYFKDASGTKKISFSDTRVKKLEHNYEWKTEGGRRLYACTRCGNVIAEEPIKQAENTNTAVKNRINEKEPTTPDSEFLLKNYKDGYEITKYLGKRDKVIIPSQIRGRNVISIGKAAFCLCPKYYLSLYYALCGLVIFGGILSLFESMVPVSIVGLEWGCILIGCLGSLCIFIMWCSRITNANFNFKYVEIPETVTKIGYGAFYNCRKLSHVKLHVHIEEIEKWAFGSCKKLEIIDFGMGKAIPNVAKLPPNLKKLGRGALPKVREITMSKKTKTKIGRNIAVFYYEDQ